MASQCTFVPPRPEKYIRISQVKINTTEIIQPSHLEALLWVEGAELSEDWLQVVESGEVESRILQQVSCF